MLVSHWNDWKWAVWKGNDGFILYRNQELIGTYPSLEAAYAVADEMDRV